MDNSKKDANLIFEIVQAENFIPEDLEILIELLAELIYNSLHESCSKKEEKGNSSFQGFGS